MNDMNFLNKINAKIANIAVEQENVRQNKDAAFVNWLEKEHAKFNDPNAKSYGWLASMIEIPVR